MLEATGSHDRLLRHVLAEPGIGHIRLNPMTTRRFVQVRGRLAKACAWLDPSTDRIDARSLAE